MSADRFLESTLLSACPGLRERWNASRGSEDDLLNAVRGHVLGLCMTGRAAEFTRFTRVMERLLGEADPVLEELIRERLLGPLSLDVREAKVPEERFSPYLGPRMRVAWG